MTMGKRMRVFWLVFCHEGRVLAADRSLWWVCGLLALLMGYGLYNGLAEIAAKEDVLAGIDIQQAKRETTNLEQLRRIMAGKEKPDPFSNPADPASVGGSLGARYAVMPYLAMAPTTLGQSDILPNYYRVTYRNKASFMDDTELENPWNLLSGHFDLAFVLIYVFPLLIFALSYNLLSAEREQGTLKILLSQPLSLAALVFGKVSVRATALFSVIALVSVITLLSARPEMRVPDQIAPLMFWLALVFAYGIFWFALVVLVNALGRSSAANALTLIAVWATLVLIVPVALNMAVSVASPAPSRTEFATRTRIVTVEGLNRYNKLLSADYRYVDKPEVLLPRNGKIEVASRRRAHYLLSKDVDREIQELLDRFDQQLAGQQALVDAWSFISPAIAAYEGATALAGTGSKRYMHFKDQVGTLHQAWKDYFDPKILSGIAIGEGDFASMPRFVWRERDPAAVWADTRRHLIRILMPALVLVGIGGWRLRRTRVA